MKKRRIIQKIIVSSVLLITFSTGLMAREYFHDTFDGPDLDPRWINDNSPVNVDEPSFAGLSDIAIDGSNGVARGSPTYTNCYNHLQTSIDGSIDFAVQADIRGNNAQSWGPAVVVYWDPNTFVSLKVPSGGFFQTYFGVGDGTLGSTGSMKWSYGQEMVTVRIEFLSDTIKFYVKGGTDSSLIYLPDLDIPRSAVFKSANALMIVGKGYQRPGTAYINPDYDNDYTSHGSADDVVIIDNAIYEPLGLYECGGPGTQYLEMDLNKDCRVNLKDLAQFAQQWQWCSDPQDPTCAQYWLQHAYFVDNFIFGQPLNARWKIDNSSRNPAGSALAIQDRFDGTLESSTNLNNVYNHVETPIIANGNFVLESVIRTNGPGGWGSGITVYWDTTHFLRFFLDLYVTKWWSNESTGEMINALGSTVAGTNTWLTLRIEFGTDKIKFYAGPTGGTLTYLPEFDEARVASTKWANALLIVGKGYQRPTLYDKPDLDNDYTADGAANFQGFDYISYQPSNVNYCGDQGTIYFDSDLYPDCRVNMRDMAEFLTQWLWCTDPADEFCDQFWTP